MSLDCLFITIQSGAQHSYSNSDMRQRLEVLEPAQEMM